MAGLLDYGLGPVTPRTRAGVPNQFVQNQGPGLLEKIYEYGSMPAKGVVSQFNTAGDAVAEAIEDPTLANVTNAGAQAGIAVGSPALFAGASGIGLLEGLRRDLGLSLSPSAANAASLEKMAAGKPHLEALLAQIRDLQTKASANVPGRSRKESEAIRERYQQQAAEAVNAFNAAVAADAEAERDREKGNYDTAVGRANSVLEKELGRDRRFSDTNVGQIFEKMGGLAPVAAGLAGGFVSRAATGPGKTTLERIANDYLLPIGEGAALGFTAANVPLLYNGFYTEPDNPQKRAYEGYARELPPDHPRKREMTDYAASLPEANPVRESALSEFYGEMGKRALSSGIEGAGGALFGSGLWRALSHGGKSARPNAMPSAGPPPLPPSSPGSSPAGARTGSGSGLLDLSRYDQLPDQARQNLRDSYVASYALDGTVPPAKRLSGALREHYAKNGVNVPITPKRIKATNDAVKAFELQYGRPPATPQEWASIFGPATLAGAAVVGAGGLLDDVRP